MNTSRRRFLKTSSRLAAATAFVPYVWTSQVAAAELYDDDLTIAAIGVGGSRGRFSRGGKIAHAAAKLGKMIAVCDVDSLHTAEFNANEKFGGKLQEYVDYRKLIDEVKPDVVTIGANDHWHVPIAIYALKAGCDVYCEKPLTLTIDEGKEICRVAKESDRVFQIGTQQRSEFGNLFLKAVAMVREGYLGDNVNAYVAVGTAPGEGPFETSDVPDNLDWDFWLGPAMAADYSLERRKFFRWYLEYSGGKMTDWGAHHIDIAQWALGLDQTGPVSVSGWGKFGNVVPEGFDWVGFFNGETTLKNGYNAATTFSVDLKFKSGSVINVNHAFSREEENGKTTAFPNGILFEGSRGRIFVNRGKLTGKPVDELTDADNAKLEEAMAGLHSNPNQNHMGNFFDSIKDRSQPVSDVFSHHRTMTSCHLCNINLMCGEDLTWDPDAEVFVDNDVANALMSRPSRPKYLGEPKAAALEEAKN